MNTRLIAARVLVRVTQDGRSLTAALDEALAKIELSKDRAFVQALSYGVCRQFHRLDFILNQLLNKPLKDAEVKMLALAGLYQLKFMRVKAHAAVSETVVAARKKPWAKSLLNALLRSYLREQEALEEKADHCRAAASSHPEWLIDRIERDWPEQTPSILAENNRQSPMVLRVNLAKIGRNDYLRLLQEQGMAAETVGFCPSALMLSQAAPVESLPGFPDGLVSVQDTAAQLAAGLLELASRQRVLDVCAAPGGKTAHILESEPDLSELVAVDIDADRMRRVEENLARLKLLATLLTGDAAQPATWWDGKPFDRILLDAPCSALGVIRRHPDIKLLRTEQDVAALQHLQQKILKAVWPLLTPGGLLLYATCSILPQENEHQIDAFLDGRQDAEIVPIVADWGLAGRCGRQIITGESAMDGFYYARIRKR